MYYMDHVETEWFYMHSKKCIITGQPSLQFCMAEEKGNGGAVPFQSIPAKQKG